MSGTVLRAVETSGNKTKNSVSIATYIQGAVEKEKAYKGSSGDKGPGGTETVEGGTSAFLCPGKGGRFKEASLMTLSRDPGREGKAQEGLWGEPSR